MIGRTISDICSELYKVRRNKYVYGTAVRGFSTGISLFKDASGNKIKLISWIEKLVMGNEHFTPLIIRKNHKLTSQDILNKNGKEWSNYWNQALKSEKGFIELFSEAKSSYVSTIAAFEKCINSSGESLFNKKKHMEEFLKKIGNKSYRTGLPY